LPPSFILKKLLIGGFEKIYEIGRVFRNEGMDRFHNPEFTSLEFYWAWADYKDLMKLTEKLFVYILKSVFGRLNIQYNDKTINFNPPFRRIEFYQLFREYTNINLEEIHPQALREKAKKMGIEIEKGEGFSETADKIYKKFVVQKFGSPHLFFIIHMVLFLWLNLFPKILKSWLISN